MWSVSKRLTTTSALKLYKIAPLSLPSLNWCNEKKLIYVSFCAVVLKTSVHLETKLMTSLKSRSPPFKASNLRMFLSKRLKIIFLITAKVTTKNVKIVSDFMQLKVRSWFLSAFRLGCKIRLKYIASLSRLYMIAEEWKDVDEASTCAIFTVCCCQYNLKTNIPAEQEEPFWKCLLLGSPFISSLLQRRHFVTH